MLQGLLRIISGRWEEPKHGGYSYRDAEVEGELAYDFARNRKNAERTAEEVKEEENSKDKKHKYPKPNLLWDVILAWWSRGSEAV